MHFNLVEVWVSQKFFQGLRTAISNQKGNFEMEYRLSYSYLKKERERVRGNKVCEG